MSKVSDSFYKLDDSRLIDEFLSDGYVIIPSDSQDALRRIRDHVAQIAAAYLEVSPPDDAEDFLETIHQRVTPVHLNDLRLHVYNSINQQSWFRPAYYQLAQSAIDTLVGNELAMQKSVNLSIQMPEDKSSLLPVHADVWSGDSAFEVVLWVPLVDCYKTKSMYLMPSKRDAEVQAQIPTFKGKSSEDFFEAIADDVIYLDVPFGSVLIFTQTQMHGNRVNIETTTRWSMNCRFKSVFSPYADKKLGEFFEPITLRPASRIGMDYVLPDGFDDG